MLKVGVILILAGIGWFVSYAFANQWIGPVGRITLGILLGTLVTLFGDYRMKKNETQGSAFIILGSAIILITLYAARYIYSFFSPVLVLSIVFFISAYITLAAIRYDKRSLALSGLFIASVAPFFTNTPNVDILGRFLYMAVVALSSVWVMFHKNWREVGAASAVMVLVYSVYYGIFTGLGDNSSMILTIAYGLSIVFLWAGMYSIIKFKDDINENDFVLSIFNGILILLWTVQFAAREWQSLILAAWMIIFAISSYVVYVKLKNIKLFYVYSLTAIVFLVTATSLELNGNALLFAFLFESAIISLVGYIVTLRPEIGHRLSLLMFFPAVMALESVTSSSWRDGFVHQDSAILFCVSILMLGLGYFFYSIKTDEDKDYVTGVAVYPYTLMIIFGSLYAYLWIWLALGSVFAGSLPVFIALFIYTLVGILTYFFGLLNSRIVYKNYGAALLIAVLIRLIFIDVWDMELTFRIVTFVVIGLMFVATSFIKKNDNLA